MNPKMRVRAWRGKEVMQDNKREGRQEGKRVRKVRDLMAKQKASSPLRGEMGFCEPPEVA
jgi:hypothetical protein